MTQTAPSRPASQPADPPTTPSALTASPELLIQLLLDRLATTLGRCRDRLAQPEAAPGAALDEALELAREITRELRQSLDLAAGGQLARDLDRLYEYCAERLGGAGATPPREAIEQVLALVGTVSDGWRAVLPCAGSGH